MILIGSTVLYKHFRDSRKPKDTDYAVSTPCNKKEPGIEYLYNPVLHKYEKNDEISLNNLLTLKISHLFWETGWDKHMWDVQTLLKHGCEIQWDFYREMRDFWNTHLPKIRRSNLNQTKDKFFTNAVNKDVNEHDELHYKLAKVPMFTRILKDGSEVEVDSDKFLALTFEEKCKVVEEETTVMAIERYSGKIPFRSAYRKQLKDNIIKHFPEQIALFAIVNYIKLFTELPDNKKLYVESK